MPLCLLGTAIAAQCGDIVVLETGEPTPLSDHMENCEVCEKLRDQFINPEEWRRGA